MDIPASNLKKAIANILLEEGYVKGVQVIADDKQGVIRIALKYTETGAPVISGIRRVSKPAAGSRRGSWGDAGVREHTTPFM